MAFERSAAPWVLCTSLLVEGFWLWLQIAFPGSLHVTSQRLCFTFEEKGVAPIKLAGKAIKSVAKLAADVQKGVPCTLCRCFCSDRCWEAS